MGGIIAGGKGHIIGSGKKGMTKKCCPDARYGILRLPTFALQPCSRWIQPIPVICDICKKVKG